MPTWISYKDQFFWVSNTRFTAQFRQVLEVAGKSARSEDEHGWVEKLRIKLDSICPGTRLQIEEIFETPEERKFWACRFIELAHTIFNRKIGAIGAIKDWGPSAIADAYLTARFLVAAARETEASWSPPIKDWDEFVNKDLRIQVA